MKKKLLIYILCLVLLFPTNVFASETSSELQTTEMQTSEITTTEAQTTETKTTVTTEEITTEATEIIYDTSTASDETTEEVTEEIDNRPEIESFAAVLVDVYSGTILYEKNSTIPRSPASLIKVVNGMVALEQNPKMDRDIDITKDMLDELPDDAASVNLFPGETISMKDALYSMLVQSANDAAVGIAYSISGSSEDYIKLMDAKVQEIGCKDTRFGNVTGIYNEDSRTTAYDMAQIGLAAYHTEGFMNILGSMTYTIPATNMSLEKVIYQTDYMMYSNNENYYKYIIAGKSSNTGDENSCLMSFANKEGSLLLAVVIGGTSKQVYNDTRKLCEYGFNNYHVVYPLENFSFSENSPNTTGLLENYYSNLEHDMPTFYVNQNYPVLVENSVSKSDLTYEINFNANKTEEIVGAVSIFYKGKKLGESPIFTNTNLYSVRPKEDIDDIGDSLLKIWVKRVLIIITCLIPVYIIWFILYLRKKKKEKEARRKARLKKERQKRDNETNRRINNAIYQDIIEKIYSDPSINKELLTSTHTEEENDDLAELFDDTPSDEFKDEVLDDFDGVFDKQFDKLSDEEFDKELFGDVSSAKDTK